MDYQGNIIVYFILDVTMTLDRKIGKGSGEKIPCYFSLGISNELHGVWKIQTKVPMQIHEKI
jgi:hypothetical protein